MKTYGTLICRCGTKVIKLSPRTKYCEVCRPIEYSKQTKEWKLNNPDKVATHSSEYRASTSYKKARSKASLKYYYANQTEILQKQKLQLKKSTGNPIGRPKKQPPLSQVQQEQKWIDEFMARRQSA